MWSALQAATPAATAIFASQLQWNQPSRGIEGACSNNLIYLLEFPLDLIMAVIVGGFTWYKSQVALKSVDDGEARLVLLPSYRVVLLSYVAVVVLFGASSLVRYFIFDNGVVDLLSWGSVLMLWGWHVGIYLVLDGVAYWLTQQSAGLATMKKVAWRTFIWASIRALTPTVVAAILDYNYLSFCLMFIPEGFRIIMYLYSWLGPASFHRRPAALTYAKWQLLYCFANIVVIVVNLTEWKDRFCFALAFVWGSLLFVPLVLYRTLLIDSDYWRGLLDDELDDPDQVEEQRQNSGKSGHTGMMVSLRAPLIGITLTEESSAALVEQLDPQFVKAPRLNYALLSLGLPQRNKDGELTTGAVGNLLAAGGTARVYSGSYKGQPLAIKLIYCLELTPEIIRNFGREANKLASLSRNEHVVHLVGICVRPPSLAMALELCYYGSLTDVLQRYYHPMANAPRDSKYIEMANRRTRLITALHCARGVAAMHSLHPPLLHLDIKAQNFLVALRPPIPIESKASSPSSSLTTNRSGSSGSIAAKQVVDEQVKFIVKIADLELSTHRGDANIRIPDTYQWTAPELLSGTLDDRKAWASTASDIFALGCVFYEIETGKMPYEDVASIDVVTRITGPEQLRPLPLTGDDHGVDMHFISLIRAMWATDPRDRPDAQEVVQRLTDFIHACSTSWVKPAGSSHQYQA